jgi:hypothetical protein
MGGLVAYSHLWHNDYVSMKMTRVGPLYPSHVALPSLSVLNRGDGQEVALRFVFDYL